MRNRQIANQGNKLGRYSRYKIGTGTDLPGVTAVAVLDSLLSLLSAESSVTPSTGSTDRFCFDLNTGKNCQQRKN